MMEPTCIRCAAMQGCRLRQPRTITDLKMYPCTICLRVERCAPLRDYTDAGTLQAAQLRAKLRRIPTRN